MTGRRRRTRTGPAAAIRRGPALALAGTAAAACTGAPEPAPDDGLPRPGSMAALGDSITRALAASERGRDCVEASWATGTAGDLGSHAQRLGIDEADVANLAVSGARVAGLADRVRAAVAARPDYVTVLVGADDACAGEAAGMTPVEFDLADVSPVDYWHPSSQGQATLSRVAWEAGSWS